MSRWDFLGSTEKVCDVQQNSSAKTANFAMPAAAKGGGLLKLLLPLIAVAALAFVAVKMFGPGAKPPELPSSGMGAMDFGSMDVSALGDAGGKLQEGFSGIQSGFTGLAESGTDGANALATKITDFSGSIDGLGLGDMSATAKPVATTMIGKFIETIQGLLDGQGDAIKGILQGPVDVLLDKLKPFA